ncbi:hypothetical protein SpCBS45565_g04719 [Spizellomyces sp. 'palustris']|nr:hypothetical protein SpCBS45565_g04719 [Spizellomyces sp. 'palustris']
MNMMGPDGNLESSLVGDNHVRGGHGPDVAYYEEDPDRDHRSHHRSERKRDKDRRRDRSRSRSRDRRKRSRSRGRDDGYDKDRERRRERDRDRDGERRRSRSRDRERRKRSRSREHRSRKGSRSASPKRSSRRGTSVTPLHLRKRKLQNWDTPPAAFPGMTAQQVKATGHFPLPGQSARLASGLGALYGADLFGIRTDGMKLSQGAAGPIAQSASIARQARRLYVGNIPYGILEDALMDFFNQTMAQLNITTAPGNAVIAAQINHDKNYAFIEFRTSEEATAAMAFDGITFAGQSLKIRRPKDYQAPAGASGTPPPIHVPGVVSTNVPDSPNKIFVGGLPPFLNDEQVMELLKSFGELRAFNLVKDGTTGLSKGFAFCEYVDPAITDIACQGLNGMELGDKKLIVQRASVGASKMGMGMGILPPLLPTAVLTGAAGPIEPTTVLLLLNMVTADELVNDEDYQDILEDIRDECTKYGTIRNITIPRPVEGREVSGVGKFSNAEQSSAALRALAGRKFADRTVVAAYYDEQQYLTGEF